MKRSSRNWKKTIGRRGKHRCRWKTRKKRMKERKRKAKRRRGK